MSLSNLSDHQATPKIIPVILCGGTGTRLWPLSHEDTPKQLLPIVNKTILLHDTLQRAHECSNCELSEIIVVTTAHLEDETIKQLKDFSADCASHVVIEPESKNTAAAIAYAALYAKNKFSENHLLWILPADHYVEDHEALRDVLQQAKHTIPNDGILTFGIKPTSPETGFGYIQISSDNIKNNDIQKVKSFTEKPDPETAKRYIQSREYLWNSGMFLASIKTLLNEYIEHAPQILSPLHTAFKDKTDITRIYAGLSKTPFDIAIMESTQNAHVISCDMGWSDVGSWHSVWDIKNKDNKGNALHGTVETHDTEDCLIHSDNLLIATIGLKDLAIVEHEGSILIADKKNSNSIKELSQAIKGHQKQSKNPELNTEEWGFAKIVSQSKDNCVKEITLKPSKKTEYHSHAKRSETWMVLSGEVTAIINGQEHNLKTQDNIIIPINSFHRLENRSNAPVKIVECQFGEIDENDVLNYTQNSDGAEFA